MHARSFLAGTILSACATVANAVNTDINGLKLGMRAPEAKASILKINPKYQLAPVMSNDKEVGIHGEVNGNTILSGVDYVAALYDMKGAAWFIGRVQTYSGDKRPSVETMRAALLEKYGPPSRSKHTGGMEWHFFRGAATPMKLPGGSGGPCAFTKSNLLGSNGGLSLVVPATFNPKCAVTINADWMTAPSGGDMVERLTVSIYDSARMYDQLEAASQAAADAAARKQKAEKANAVKPQL